MTHGSFGSQEQDAHRRFLEQVSALVRVETNIGHRECTASERDDMRRQGDDANKGKWSRCDRQDSVVLIQERGG